jgi:hydroxypyruvate reductase
VETYLKALEEIFRAGVARVDPEVLIHDCLHLEGDALTVDTGEDRVEYDLSRFHRVVVIGFGKATARMAKAVEKILGSRIYEGLIAVKYSHTESLDRIRTIEAGHPVPDQSGMEAARQIAALARQADEGTLVITLISGGGSALIPHPWSGSAGGSQVTLSLEEKQNTTEVLLRCGAVINEINCLRKHLSQIKGGRLARMIHPAASLNLILSDVVGDRLDAIASGPTTWDETTFDDALRIVGKYDIEADLPEAVLRIFSLGAKGAIPETPKKDDPVFENVNNLLVGTNYHSLEAAAKAAKTLGLSPVVLSSQIVGEAREVAKVYCGIGKDARRKGLFGPRPLCLIGGGETTVTLNGSGKGGRNQEMALAFLAEIEQDPAATEGLYFLAASTDGNDGPTDAAGAFACSQILRDAERLGLSPADYLKNNDAYSFFDACGRLLKTGPTNTNVCDIQLLIVS